VLTVFIKVSRIDLIIYVLLALLRIILFFDVHAGLKEVNPKLEDKGLGSFLAEYVDDS